MSHHKPFSLITVCHDRWEDLCRVWPTWVGMDYPAVEHIIVASGPSDAPMAIADEEGFSGRVIRVRNAPYYRPSFLRNLGARLASGEYLGFVDADIALHYNWVTTCVGRLQTSCDLVMHQLLIDGMDTGGHSGTHAISRWLFEKVRGYSENLDDAWGYEDTDLYERCQRAGGRVGGYPAGMVVHTDHDDRRRSKHLLDPQFTPRTPKVFLKHMRTCDEDAAIHPYEANHSRRVGFPPEVVTTVNKDD